MSRLSELAVSKRSVTLLLAAALFVSGISAWGSLKQELLPDIEFPVLTIIAPYPGAGAADVAAQVAEPIERAIAGVPRLERLQSTSANSIALVIAQFEFGADVKETRAQIEQNLENVGLPASVEPSVTALNINASPVIVASIRAQSEDGLADAARIARTEIVPELLGLEGVSSADVTGGLEDRLLITLDPDALVENNISTSQISGILAANNLTFPSGQLPEDGEQIPVSTIGSLDSIGEVEALVVGYRMPAAAPGTPPDPAARPTPVAIGDLGTVELAGAATTGYARTDGNPALTLTVTKTSTANTVDVAAAVEEALAEISAANADVIDIEVVSDLSVFISESRDGLLKEGGLGALFAVLTIFLFLFNLRSTVVAAVSIPLSILTALVVMQITGITINIMTLGGLAVAVGRVVDDAIVVLENIYRHLAMGESKRVAVVQGPREVATAITSATITTVGVFLPLGFVGGLVSQFFLPFALTVTFALLASLVVALTVVPVLAYLLIDRVPRNVDEHGEPKSSLWVRAYTPTIRFALDRRAAQWGILAISAVLFAGSLAIAPLLPTQFINAGSEKLLQVTIAPPPGTSTTAVLERAEQAEALLIGADQVLLVQTSVPGEGDTSFQTIVSVTEQGKRLSDLLAPVKTDGFDVAVAQAAGFTSNSLNIVVAGEDPAAVEAASALLLERLADNTNLLNLKSDLSKATPEVQILVDPNAAIGVGLTAAQVAGEVRGALTGTTATRIQLADQPAPVDVVLRLDPETVQSVEDLADLPVGTVAKAPLGEIAEVVRVDAQGSITRIDQLPAASVTAEIASEDTGAVSGEVQAEITALEADGSIPEGVEVRLAGVTQQQNEAFGGLFVSMGVAVLLVYVAMVLTFNSLITPFVILFTLPLATIGAFPALLLTGRPIGVSALIGFLMLIGIVVTNAIVLLDLVERLRSQGMSTRDALIEGGRTRVRPILMTAIATILALLPLAAGLNEGSIIAAELGTVVIGGLFSSTFLTLIVVPVVYSLVDSARTFRSRRRAARATAGDASGAAAG